MHISAAILFIITNIACALSIICDMTLKLFQQHRQTQNKTKHSQHKKVVFLTEKFTAFKHLIS